MESIIHEAISRQGKDLEEDSLETGFESELNIVVLGIGGSGSNTIQRIFEMGIMGAELYAINADAQHLLQVNVSRKILIGRNRTKGLGPGSLPQIGAEAAQESKIVIEKAIGNADIVFLTCGLGGGGGTGGIPVVAEIARDAGALTIAVVTLPFSVEGGIRMDNAETGLELLHDAADTVIVVPNDKLLEVFPHLPLQITFKMVDEVLFRTINLITNVLKRGGTDFEELKSIIKDGHFGYIGLGEAEGDNCVLESTARALRNPLLIVNPSEVKKVLVQFVASPNIKPDDFKKGIEKISQHFNRLKKENIHWVATVDQEFENLVRTGIVATGVERYGVEQKKGQSTSTAKYGLDFVR